MSEARYVQRGETLDYFNSTEKTIRAGEVIPLITRIGVAGTEIPPGKTGSIHVCGAFEIPKAGDAPIPMGTEVFFDGIGITDKDKEDAADDEGETVSHIPAGYAAAGAQQGDTVVLVKLLG